MGVIKRNQLAGVVKYLRRECKPIVTTNGAFDILHTGHLYSLQEAKKYGTLIVGVNSDKSIQRYKSKYRPIIPEKERVQIVAALEPVDYVFIFGEGNPKRFLQAIKPDFHVKSKEGFKGLEREIVERFGGQIVLLDDIPSIRTSDIIAKCFRSYYDEEFRHNFD